MGLNRLRVDSIEMLHSQKTVKALLEENERLKEQVAAMDEQLTDAQIALCDMYELLIKE